MYEMPSARCPMGILSSVLRLLYLDGSGPLDSSLSESVLKL
jgi:hypothetical protein